MSVKDKDGWTPVHYACSDWGSVDTVRVLLEGAKSSWLLWRMNLNTWNGDGLTPLMMACGQCVTQRWRRSNLGGWTLSDTTVLCVVGSGGVCTFENRSV